MTYRCGECRREVDLDSNDLNISCNSCGCKHFYKIRKQVAKTIKAE